MSKLFLVVDSYSPNTASTNRILGMIKRFSERGIDTTVCFFRLENKYDKPQCLTHVNYLYYGDILNWLPSKIEYLLSRFIYPTHFLRNLNAGDKVYVYGCDYLIHRLVKRKGVEVFHERTESPDVVKSRFVNISQYLTACQKLSRLFVISNQLRDYFINKGLDGRKIEVVNMTVDVSRFDNLQKEQTEKYIAYCGKATNNKDGVDGLIKAFALTSATHKDVKLYIIGAPPRPHDESGNIELTESLGIKDKVVFTGTVGADRMPQILVNATTLALDRPKNEQAQYGFPTKLGEYLLSGNAVVVTKVGDIPCFLEDGKTALLAEPDNVQDFASKLTWVLDNPNEAKEIGMKGREVALEYFDSRKEYDKVINAIECL